MRSLTMTMFFAAVLAAVVLVGFSTSAEAKFSPEIEKDLMEWENVGNPPVGTVFHAFATVTVEQFKRHPSLAEARNVLNITFTPSPSPPLSHTGKPFAVICQFHNDELGGLVKDHFITCRANQWDSPDDLFLSTVVGVAKWWDTDKVEMGKVECVSDAFFVHFTRETIRDNQFFDFNRFVDFLAARKDITDITVSLNEMPVDTLRAYPFKVDVSMLRRTERY